MEFRFLVATLSLLSMGECLEDFSEIVESGGFVEAVTTASLTLDSVNPIIVPTQTPAINVPLQNPCYSHCNYAPNMCNQQCQTPPQTKIIKVPMVFEKRVPQIVTMVVPKQPITEAVPEETDTIIECPPNFHFIEDESDKPRCVSTDVDLKVACPPSFTWLTDRCVARTTICPNEFVTMAQNKCTPRLACPQHYRLQGDECIAPPPTCPKGWRWNGRNCQSESVTCPSGYTLSENNVCVHETYMCPVNFKRFGNRCVKEPPKCLPDFIMNEVENVCTKITRRCPSGSYRQSGTCLTVKYVCPPGSTVADENTCTTQETTYEIVKEKKFVTKRVQVPGRGYNCGNPYPTDYPCTNPCISNDNCINPCIPFNHCDDQCSSTNNCIPTSGKMPVLRLPPSSKDSPIFHSSENPFTL